MSPSSEGHLSGLAYDFIAFWSLLLVVIFIIVVTFTNPYLTTSGSFPSTSHTLLVVGTTILATLLANLVSSRIRRLLLGQIDISLREMYIRHAPSWDRAPTPATGESASISNVDRRWRGILSIDALSEKPHNMGTLLQYLACGLITTAIVAAVTPSATTRVVLYSPIIPDANYEFNASCVYMVPSIDIDPTRDYSWDLKNGSSFYVPANAGGCPTRTALYLADTINNVDPDAYAYADLGVAIQSNAIGTPVSVYSTQANLGQLYSNYDLSLLNTTQCVPVMSKNPIQCRKGGTLERDVASNALTATSADGGCTGTLPFPFFNVSIPAQQNLMANFMCPAGGPGSIGKGTIVMSGTYGYAGLLADRLLESAPDPLPADYTYVVTCTVDTTTAFTYRTVTLQFQAATNGSQSSFARVLSAADGKEGECTPMHPTISNILFATAAAANWQTLSQNEGIDGYPDVLLQMAGDWRRPPYAFENSVNALEDTLGVVAALVAARVNTSGLYVPADWAGDHGSVVSGEAVVVATRLGSGRLEAVVLVLPPLVSLLILARLMFKKLGLDLLRCKHERGSVAPKYSSSMTQLMGLGHLVNFVTEDQGDHITSHIETYHQNASLSRKPGCY